MGLNFQDVLRDVHDLSNHQLRVNASVNANSTVYIGTPTLYAVVNTSAAGDSVANIGFATVSVSNPTLYAVVNTGGANTGNVTLNPSPNFIGIVTVANPGSAALSGNVTLDPGSRTGILGNLTLSDSKGFIGLVTIGHTVTANLNGGSIDEVGQINNTVEVNAFSSTVHGAADEAGPVKIGGRVKPQNAVISTASGTRTNAWFDTEGRLGVFGDFSTTFAGNVTLDAGSKTQIVGNITLSDPKGFIGLVTAVVGNTVNVNLASGLGEDDANPIFTEAHVTQINAGASFIGLVTAVPSTTARTITGNVTLSDAKTYIGLVTATPAWGSEATVYATVISASGNTTLFVAPASNRFFIKDIEVGSLGRSEIQFLSGATLFMPFKSLSTTSGYFGFYGEMGKPARAQADAFVANLNGGATVSIGVTYRIAP